MPQVRFIQEPKLPVDFKYKGYTKDKMYEMTQDEADRWVRRGVAEIVSENKAVIHDVQPEAAKSSEEKANMQEELMQKKNEEVNKLTGPEMGEKLIKENEINQNKTTGNQQGQTTVPGSMQVKK